MVKKDTSAEDKALLNGWADFGDGVHATRSPQIIQQALNAIIRQHIFCIVVAKGYESGKVVLLEYDQHRIVLDRPNDWPAEMSSQPLRILFKDRTQLWNKFVVELLEVTDDSLITTMPSKYVRLQRRDNYRVDAPRGSRVLFRHRGELKDFGIENISANGGMFVSPSRKVYLPLGDLLTDMIMRFPVTDEKEAEVKIGEGRVVRSCDNDRRELCFGVQFLIKGPEEKELLQYVRLREREMLRKGMAD
ncbi:PilZ domain-containing protein [Desulfurivibrio alkaliphilus]|uniref:Type IV pilus assembly PilZ n=1 Tax=Desulfurivibrio alkaliphilus (strain DSM 19089 / UNIQEM U267 / AHT2) TaxID=589865 RepID=D6Z0V3_DESAT|nr:PilZ domain-containing protein [Desulfurivibrio alkaliphilus]ADH87213.1 type IV pilus assembly PilZ [Desulfurivibrio alkaliphilus AHT 2]